MKYRKKEVVDALFRQKQLRVSRLHVISRLLAIFGHNHRSAHLSYCDDKYGTSLKRLKIFGFSIPLFLTFAIGSADIQFPPGES